MGFLILALVAYAVILFVRIGLRLVKAADRIAAGVEALASRSGQDSKLSPLKD